jgi:hypothetical protein
MGREGERKNFCLQVSAMSTRPFRTWGERLDNSRGDAAAKLNEQFPSLLLALPGYNEYATVTHNRRASPIGTHPFEEEGPLSEIVEIKTQESLKTFVREFQTGNYLYSVVSNEIWRWELVKDKGDLWKKKVYSLMGSLLKIMRTNTTEYGDFTRPPPPPVSIQALRKQFPKRQRITRAAEVITQLQEQPNIEPEWEPEYVNHGGSNFVLRIDARQGVLKDLCQGESTVAMRVFSPGAKIIENDLSNEDKQKLMQLYERLWTTEAYLTLRASSLGYGPPVYAVHNLQGEEGKGLFMLMHASQMNLFQWIDTNCRQSEEHLHLEGTFNPMTTRVTRVMEAVKRAIVKATYDCMLVIELRPENIVIDEVQSGTPGKVTFKAHLIDFDPKRTVKLANDSSGVTAKIVTMIHCVVLAHLMRCAFDALLKIKSDRDTVNVYLCTVMQRPLKDLYNDIPQDVATTDSLLKRLYEVTIQNYRLWRVEQTDTLKRLEAIELSNSNSFESYEAYKLHEQILALEDQQLEVQERASNLREGEDGRLIQEEKAALELKKTELRRLLDKEKYKNFDIERFVMSIVDIILWGSKMDRTQGGGPSSSGVPCKADSCACSSDPDETRPLLPQIVSNLLLKQST